METGDLLDGDSTLRELGIGEGSILHAADLAESLSVCGGLLDLSKINPPSRVNSKPSNVKTLKVGGDTTFIYVANVDPLDLFSPIPEDILSKVGEVVDIVTDSCDAMVELFAPIGRFINVNRLRQEMSGLPKGFQAEVVRSDGVDCEVARLFVPRQEEFSEALRQRLRSLIETFELDGGYITVTDNNDE